MASRYYRLFFRGSKTKAEPEDHMDKFLKDKSKDTEGKAIG